MRLEVHPLAIILKATLPVRTSFLLAIEDTLICNLASTLLLLRVYTGAQLPDLVHNVPGVSAIIGPFLERPKSMRTQRRFWASVQLVLATRCYSGGRTSASVIFPWFVLAVV